MPRARAAAGRTAQMSPRVLAGLNCGRILPAGHLDVAHGPAYLKLLRRGIRSCWTFTSSSMAPEDICSDSMHVIGRLRLCFLIFARLSRGVAPNNSGLGTERDSS
jgi:hypothetical protein